MCLSFQIQSSAISVFFIPVGLIFQDAEPFACAQVSLLELAALSGDLLTEYQWYDRTENNRLAEGDGSDDI